MFIYEMVAGCPPFYDEDIMSTYKKILGGKFSFPSHFSAQCRDLIRKLLQVNHYASAFPAKACWHYIDRHISVFCLCLLSEIPVSCAKLFFKRENAYCTNLHQLDGLTIQQDCKSQICLDWHTIVLSLVDSPFKSQVFVGLTQDLELEN